MGQKRNTYRDFVGKPKGKRPLERPRWKWEGIIKMYVRGIGWGGIDWIDAWRGLVSMVINLRVLQNFGEILQ
jgi:hypothetical protein